MNKQTSSKIISVLLILLLLTSIGISIWAWMNRCQHPEHPPEFNIPDIELNAEEIYSKDTSKLSPDSNHVTITYDHDITIDLSEAKANIYFENPKTSTHSIKITLYVNDVEIAETGLIPPGYRIETIDNLDTTTLQTGPIDGIYIIENYDAETGEKAIIQNKAELNITVVE